MVFDRIYRMERILSLRKHPDNDVYNEFVAEILTPRDRNPGIASL
jgi:hypothetical protein